MEPSTTPTADSMNSFPTCEDQQLDDVLADVEFLADRGSYTSAAMRFFEVRRAFERHTDPEKQLLVPLLTAPTQRTLELLEDAQVEHQTLRAMIDNVAAGISHRDRPRFRESLEALSTAIKKHHRTVELLLHGCMKKDAQKKDTQR